jgi:pSer/pThr/pTyr-binding forkhead associated (FHA) protein
MAAITVLFGDHRGERYPLGRRTNVIGRAESLSIQILDGLVSRKHVQIRFDPYTSRYSVIDMASKNGVFVNGAKLATETFLADRDRIRIGNTLLLFTEQDLGVNEAALHRFKRAGERLKPTHLDLQVRQPHAAVARLTGIGRDSEGLLVAL